METEPWPTYYWGRKWDAPMTDDAVLMPEELAEAMFNGEVVQNCGMCHERMCIEDDLFLTPSMSTHLECQLRIGLGDVQHLEKRCLCFLGYGNEITYETDHYETYREGAQAALQWVLNHHQGRFHD